MHCSPNLEKILRRLLRTSAYMTVTPHVGTLLLLGTAGLFAAQLLHSKADFGFPGFVGTHLPTLPCLACLGDPRQLSLAPLSRLSSHSLD
jgi:hypothetical protein